MFSGVVINCNNYCPRKKKGKPENCVDFSIQFDTQHIIRKLNSKSHLIAVERPLQPVEGGGSKVNKQSGLERVSE